MGCLPQAAARPTAPWWRVGAPGDDQAGIERTLVRDDRQTEEAFERDGAIGRHVDEVGDHTLADSSLHAVRLGEVRLRTAPP
ncbi:MAG: hypothetical protein AB1651_04060 [Pseudomonadota bacterium]